jgi:hypothetical protein
MIPQRSIRSRAAPEPAAALATAVGSAHPEA